MKTRFLLAIALATLATLISGCTLASPTAGPAIPDPPAVVGDPMPPTATPPPGPAVTPFTLTRPIRPGDTVVRGTGPAGVPIMLVDVTFMGQPLAQTVIGADGTFDVTVQPLGGNHRLGLMLGELAGTPWTDSSFRDSGYKGQEAMQVPQVGFLYDTVLVQAP
jgi:hypothetical protein